MYLQCKMSPGPVVSFATETAELRDVCAALSRRHRALHAYNIMCTQVNKGGGCNASVYDYRVFLGSSLKREGARCLFVCKTRQKHTHTHMHTTTAIPGFTTKYS